MSGGMFTVRKQKKQEGKLPSTKLIFSAGIFLALVFVAVIGYFFMKSEAEIESVSIFSQPPEAAIYLNGEDTGKTTPSTLMLQIGKSYIIEFRKDDMIGGIQFIPSEENREVNIVLKKR